MSAHDFCMLANPLVILCKNNKRQSFNGIEINEFSFKICNDTKTIQTDVGICVASNPRQILLDGSILKENKGEKVNGGLKDIEHVAILTVDKFGDTKPLSFKVKYANVNVQNSSKILKISSIFYSFLDNDTKNHSS